MSAFKMPLFGKSTKSPSEVVKSLREALHALDRGDKKVEKVRDLANFVPLEARQ